MPKNRELPLSLFEVVPSVLPHLMNIFRRCQLSPTELFILSQIKHFGKDYKGQRIFLGKDMVDILKDLFRYSASQASRDISRLIDRGLIDWIHITPDDKEELFGIRSGKKWALALLESGSDKIDEFKVEINRMYQLATAKVPGVILTPFSRALAPLTREIANSLREPPQA